MPHMAKKLQIIREIFKGDHNAAAVRKMKQKQTRGSLAKKKRFKKAYKGEC